jgi:hypothetical protein
MTELTLTASGERPSLLVARDDYPALRERQAREPWASWADRAEAQLGADLGGERVRERCESIVAVASGAALCHVLDRGDPAERVRAVLRAVAHYDEHVTPDLGSPDYDNQWHVVVPPSGALFSLVVALDAVGPAAEADERVAAEERLARAADWFYDEQDGPWKAARYGAYGVWAAYERDGERVAEAAERAMDAFGTEWPDGVYREGCEYANNRFAGRGVRTAKVHFPDVLANATELDFYGDKAVREDFAWLFGYSLSPVTFEGGRDVYTFGDSGPAHTATARSSCAYRARKFGGRVENNAAWAITGPFEGRHVFETYVLTDRVPADPDPPVSRVFPGGGAWLLADSADPEAPAGVLWNPTDASGHSHPDVNAVHLCAHGEHVLRNSGYNGWGNGHGGFDWTYVHDRAVANNVVLTDYPFDAPDRDPPEGGHVRRRGAGVTEGIVGGPGPIEYACGDAGEALPDAGHRRSLVAVHPRGGDADGGGVEDGDGIGGYWVLFDEVAAPDAATVHTALHPATVSDPEAVEPGREFRAPVDAAPRTDRAVSLTLRYGAAPDAVDVREGLLADWDRSAVGRYLYATYEAADERRLSTVLYPHVGASPDFDSLAGEGYAGTRIDGGTAVDRAVALTGGDLVEVAGARIAGRAALFRETGNGSGGGEGEAATPWFLRRGTRFERGARGLRADAPVSAAFDGGVGTVVTRRPTAVTLRDPDAEAVRLDGDPVDAAATDGGLQVTIPAGRHWIALE